MVHNADEARAFLEEKLVIESGMELNATDLMDALIHISVFDSMPSLARNTVWSVVLLLDQLKLDGTGKAIVRLIQCKVDVLIDTATQQAIDSIKVAVESMTSELKTASTVVAETATQITATSTSY